MKLNGNLVLNADSTGEIKNAYIERLSANPTFASGEKGRVYFNTSNATYYFNDGTGWSPFATGGNAATLQTEVDNTQASLGALVNDNGTYNAAAISTGILAGSTSITGALSTLATYAAGHDTLQELTDVGTMTGLASNQFLQFNGTKWTNHTLVLADVSGITAVTADVNLLAGLAAAGLTGTELGYVDGVTSSIQTQLNNKQALNTGLTGLAALANGATTGIVVQTGVNTFTDRSLVAPAAGITIANPDGVSGAPTFALANDLAALEGLTTSGYSVRNDATGTWTTRTITGAAGNTVVTNGSGVVSDTTIDLATITQGSGGSFVKVVLDGYGRVTANAAVTTADVTALVDGTYVNITGDSMSGTLTFTGGATVSGLPTPTADTQAANKAYVDAVAAGLSWKQAVAAASVANLTLSGAQTVDGVALVAGDRVLVKDQTLPAQNGIYIVAAGAWTRSTDMDQTAEFQNASVFVSNGTVNHDTGWTETNAVPTVGTSAVSFVQFSGASAYTWGDGLKITGNLVDVNMGAGIAMLPSDEVGIDLYDEPNGALILTSDGSVHSTASASKLYLKLDTAGALAQTASGLKINASSVTNAMLFTPSVALNADGGSSTLALGQTFQVIGTAAKGISTSVTGQTITFTIADASSSQKGVATFNTGDFLVTAGDVTIKAAGVDNAQLANSTVGYSGTTGGVQTVALGSSFSIVGGSTPITTVSAAGSVTINVAAATTGALGLASFNSADFTVSSGAVSAIAKNLDSLTDVVVATSAAGQTLVYNGTNFVNRQTYFLYTSGAASTSHTVNHNLGQMYCNVTVIDSTDEVVIPQSIKFMTSSQLVVTFTSSIDCKVVVMGVNPA